MKPIAELTQDEYEALPSRERAAVTRLLAEQDHGLVSPASSLNDLTPASLADYYDHVRADALARIRRSASGQDIRTLIVRSAA